MRRPITYRNNSPCVGVARMIRGGTTDVSFRRGISGVSAENRISNLKNTSGVLPLETSHSEIRDRQRTCRVTLRRLRATFVELGKAVLHILSVCLWPEVYSLQCACAILSSVASPVLQYFSPLSHKR